MIFGRASWEEGTLFQKILARNEKQGKMWYDKSQKAMTLFLYEQRTNWNLRRPSMNEYTYITLRQKPELKEEAAVWFHDKWGVPQEAYLKCMQAYLNNETEYGWYLCLDSGRIVGGLGVIENDFHDRKDLTPNVCAVYTEKEYRCQGIAGQLLDIVVKDMKSKGITPIYLITDHTSFYERYGWEFLCMVQGDDQSDRTRMYMHR